MEIAKVSGKKTEELLEQCLTLKYRIRCLLGGTAQHRRSNCQLLTKESSEDSHRKGEKKLVN